MHLKIESMTSPNQYTVELSVNYGPFSALRQFFFYFYRIVVLLFSVYKKGSSSGYGGIRN